MRILVTGSNGFTGQHFLKAGGEAGHDVVELSSDIRNRDELIAEVKQVEPEAVVHLAAISHVAHANSLEFYDVNLIGTMNLLDALAGLPTPPRVLLASSANVYGNCENLPIPESQIPAPINHYAMSKLGMEHMARTYLDKLPLFFVRPFNYTGVGQSDSFILPKIVSHFVRREKVIELGNIDVEREFNDVRWVCKNYLNLLTQAQSGEIYNICSGRPVLLRHLLNLIYELTGHEIEIKINPAFVRSNELHRLCGDPAKLISTVGDLGAPTFEQTINWMLGQ